MKLTDEEWCDFNDMPKAQCDHCRSPQSSGRPDPRPLMAEGTTVVAKHDGRCPVCEDPIEAEKDHIGLVEDPDHELDGRWIHYGCGR